MINDSLKTFKDFDAEEVGYIEEVDFILAMFLCMGCDVDSEKLD